MFTTDTQKSSHIFFSLFSPAHIEREMPWVGVVTWLSRVCHTGRWAWLCCLGNLPLRNHCVNRMAAILFQSGHLFAHKNGSYIHPKMNLHTHTHTHTHTHIHTDTHTQTHTIYIYSINCTECIVNQFPYMYLCVCVCVCVCGYHIIQLVWSRGAG